MFSVHECLLLLKHLLNVYFFPIVSVYLVDTFAFCFNYMLYNLLFYFQIGEVSYHDCQGISVDSKEREDIAADLGPVNNIMILRNHGLLAMGTTIEQAWDRMETLMLACESQVYSVLLGLDIYNYFL